MSGSHTAQIVPFPPRIPAPVLFALEPVGPLAGSEDREPQATISTGNQPKRLELGHRGQFCGILYVARLLRLEAVELRTVVAHIRAHITQSGFPAPVSSRLRHGVPLTGAGAVTPKSEWLRASVDGWLAARAAASLTSAARAALAADRAAQVDATLAARLSTAPGTGA